MLVRKRQQRNPFYSLLEGPDIWEYVLPVAIIVAAVIFLAVSI